MVRWDSIGQYIFSVCLRLSNFSSGILLPISFRDVRKWDALAQVLYLVYIWGANIAVTGYTKENGKAIKNPTSTQTRKTCTNHMCRLQTKWFFIILLVNSSWAWVVARLATVFPLSTLTRSGGIFHGTVRPNVRCLWFPFALPWNLCYISTRR